MSDEHSLKMFRPVAGQNFPSLDPYLANWARDDDLRVIQADLAFNGRLFAVQDLTIRITSQGIKITGGRISG